MCSLGDVIVEAAAADTPALPRGCWRWPSLWVMDWLLAGDPALKCRAVPGDVLVTELWWDVLEPAAAAGELAIETDGAYGRCALSRRAARAECGAERVGAGARVRGQYALKLPAELEAGVYRLAVECFWRRRGGGWAAAGDWSAALDGGAVHAAQQRRVGGGRHRAVGL